MYTNLCRHRLTEAARHDSRDTLFDSLTACPARPPGNLTPAASVSQPHILKYVRRVKTTKYGGDLLSKTKHRLELQEAKGF